MRPGRGLIIPGRLRLLSVQAAWAGLAGFAALALGYAVLRHGTETFRAGMWLLVSTSVFCYFLIHLTVRLKGNRSSSREGLHPTLGPANLLTLARSLLAAYLAGFVAFPPGAMVIPWAPGVIYLLVVVGDALDGLVARRTGRVTELGSELDMATDRMAFLAAIGVAVVQDKLHSGFLILGLLPYLFAAHMYFRRRASGPTPSPVADGFRQLVGTLLTLFLAVALLPMFNSSQLHLPGVFLFCLALLSFGRDWLRVAREPMR